MEALRMGQHVRRQLRIIRQFPCVLVLERACPPRRIEFRVARKVLKRNVRGGIAGICGGGELELLEYGTQVGHVQGKLIMPGQQRAGLELEALVTSAGRIRDEVPEDQAGLTWKEFQLIYLVVLVLVPVGIEVYLQPLVQEAVLAADLVSRDGLRSVNVVGWLRGIEAALLVAGRNIEEQQRRVRQVIV